MSLLSRAEELERTYNFVDTHGPEQLSEVCALEIAVGLIRELAADVAELKEKLENLK